MTKRCLRTFLRDDDGAVSVEWVVLTAAIVSLALLVLPPIYRAVDSIAQDIVADIEGEE